MFFTTDIKGFLLISSVLLTTNIYVVESFAINADNFTSNDDINGQTILDIAKQTEDSKLELIGHAIRNLQCKFSSCMDWSTWSSCIHIAGQFGIKSRTRNCKSTAENCPYPADNENMLEEQICKFFKCPNNYKVTGKGYCMLYSTNRSSWHNSRTICERDGGTLANIDSREKQQDIVDTLKLTGIPTWIDGIRKNSTSAWEYSSHSTAQSKFSDWLPGEPDQTGQSCKTLYKGNGNTDIRWVDRACSDPVHFLCEIKE